MTDLLKADLVPEKHFPTDSTSPHESLEHAAGTINSLDGPDADKSEAERLAIVRTVNRFSQGRANEMAGQEAHEKG